MAKAGGVGGVFLRSKDPQGALRLVCGAPRPLRVT